MDAGPESRVGVGGESSKSVMKKYQFNYFIFVICMDTYVLGFFLLWLFIFGITVVFFCKV